MGSSGGVLGPERLEQTHKQSKRGGGKCLCKDLFKYLSQLQISKEKII